MPEIKTIFFDLDGTLVDSRGLIIAAANHTLTSFGLEEQKEEYIIKNMKFETSYLVSKIINSDNQEKVKEAVDVFTDYWKSNIENGIKLFPGVAETLDYLKQIKVKNIILLSNGVKNIIEKILDRFKIRKYFKNIISGDDADCIKPTACPINRAFENLVIKNRHNSMIVGDMTVDIKAGKAAGIFTCGVTYGIGNKQDIIREEPDFLIDSIMELKDIIDF